jgi:hypothetical protein
MAARKPISALLRSGSIIEFVVSRQQFFSS